MIQSTFAFKHLERLNNILILNYYCGVNIFPIYVDFKRKSMVYRVLLIFFLRLFLD